MAEQMKIEDSSMNLIIGGCGPQLEDYLLSAIECWVAVALLSRTGYDFIKENIPWDCEQHYLIGTWLPSDAGVLLELFESGLDARIFTNSGFHPKLYLIRIGKRYTAFLGSSNATASGLFDNVELNVQITDQAACKQLLAWFKLERGKGKAITQAFLKDYKPLQLNRRAVTAQVAAEQEELQKGLEGYEVLVQKLRNMRRRKSFYEEQRLSRQDDIQQLRHSLNFPQFRKLDLDNFLPSHALGTIVGFHWPKIRQNEKVFRKLLRFLASSQLDIAATLDEALSANYKLDGVGIALVTKLLTLFNPGKYCTWNNRSDSILRQLGYVPERGTTVGQKYERLCGILQTVAKKANIQDLAVLDLCLIRIEEEDSATQ